MTQDAIQRAKDDKRDVWVYSILVGSLLLWNIIFFYTDLWKVFLEPIGFHEWVKGISWFWSTYTDIQNRLTYHDVDVQKYMVILTWGACLSMLVGLIFTSYAIFTVDFTYIVKAFIEHNKDKKFVDFLYFVAVMLPFVGLYVEVNSFGKVPTSYLGAIFLPNFLNSLFFQIPFWGVFFVTPFMLIIWIKVIFLKVGKSADAQNGNEK